MAAPTPPRSPSRPTAPPRLRPYARVHRDSGVVAYATGPDYIIVQFRSGDTYLYTDASASRPHIAAMKRLAAAGAGLSAYISRHTHDRYARKLT